MSFNNKVIWSEGLFLQPQHFQQHDRYIENLVNNRPQATALNSWGFSELKLDPQLLTLGKIALVRCKGIFPDGTAFNLPDNDPVPPSIDIPGGITNSYIYLALPLQSAGSPLTGNGKDADSQIPYRYQPESIEVTDNNIGPEVTVSLQVGQLSLCFMLEQQERGGYTCLPIARIKESSAGQKLQLDEQFVPPCLDVQAVPKLANFMQELLGLLNYRGEILAQQVIGTSGNRASEIVDVMLLHMINHSQSLLEFLVAKKGIHPESLLIHLVQLIGGLSTFMNKSKRPIKIPAYQHNDLQSIFDPIIIELRKMLSVMLEQNAVPLPLEARKFGMWVSPITDHSLLATADFVLAVSADLPPEVLRHQFIAQTKIASVEEIPTLISRGLSGIELLSLMVVPREIPFNSGYIYFSLSKKGNYWQGLEKSAGMAIQVGNQFSKLELQLWAIKVNT